MVRLSRRSFIGRTLVTMGAAGLALGSCKPAPAPEPTAAPATAAAEPAGAATVAPAPKVAGQVRFLERHSTAFGKVWTKAIEAFNAKYPDIEVERIQPASDEDYNQKLVAMVAGGDVPDVFWTTWDWVAYQRQGFFKNLTPIMEAEGFDIDKLYEPQWIQMWRQKDGDYGLPWDAFIFNLNYNKAMFDAKGLPYPNKDDAHTWQEVLEMGKSLTEWKGNIPVTLGTQAWRPYWGIWWIWMVQAGYSLYDPDMTKVNLDQPEVWEMLDFFAEWGWKHRVEPTTAIQTDLPLNFDSGNIGTSIMAVCQWSGTRELAKWPWDVSPFPQWSKASKPQVLGWVCPIVILDKAPNPDNAWRFLKEASGPEAYIEMYKSGMSMPTLTAHANPVHQAFIDCKPPDNNEHTIKWARYMATDVPWNNGAWMTILNIINDACGQVYLGKMKAQQAMTEVALPQCNKALKDLHDAGSI